MFALCWRIPQRVSLVILKELKHVVKTPTSLIGSRPNLKFTTCSMKQYVCVGGGGHEEDRI